jgi:hypothetical protein
MTSTVEINVQKAIDPNLKIENLGEVGNAMTPTLLVVEFFSLAIISASAVCSFFCSSIVKSFTNRS